MRLSYRRMSPSTIPKKADCICPPLGMLTLMMSRCPNPSLGLSLENMSLSPSIMFCINSSCACASSVAFSGMKSFIFSVSMAKSARAQPWDASTIWKSLSTLSCRMMSTGAVAMKDLPNGVPGALLNGTYMTVGSCCREIHLPVCHCPSSHVSPSVGCVVRLNRAVMGSSTARFVAVSAVLLRISSMKSAPRR